MEPPGFWFSNLRKSVQGPVSKRVRRKIGVPPIRASEESGSIVLIG
jgi:hypothetical protein